MSKPVDISVYMLTYNHEKYVEQAIESVLSQKTEYSFELVISDDASTDGTAEILKKYSAKYPDIIRININEKNVGIPRNLYNTRCMCRGRYIADLAGDDYYINDNKLQLQAEFLDLHPEYYLVCTRVAIRYDDSTENSAVLPGKRAVSREYTMKDFLSGKNFNANGMMLRNPFLTEEGRSYFYRAFEISDKVDDAVDNYLILKKGKVYTLDVITTAYRVPLKNRKTATNYNSRFTLFEKMKQDIDLYNKMYEVWGGEASFKNRYINSSSYILFELLFSNDREKWWNLYNEIPEEYRLPAYSGVLIKSVPQLVKNGLDRIIRLAKHRFTSKG